MEIIKGVAKIEAKPVSTGEVTTKVTTGVEEAITEASIDDLA